MDEFSDLSRSQTDGRPRAKNPSQNFNSRSGKKALSYDRVVGKTVVNSKGKKLVHGAQLVVIRNKRLIEA